MYRLLAKRKIAAKKTGGHWPPVSILLACTGHARASSSNYLQSLWRMLFGSSGPSIQGIALRYS
jgi:hypothetical protein